MGSDAAHGGGSAGLGAFLSDNVVGYAHSLVGFRSVVLAAWFRLLFSLYWDITKTHSR